MEYLDRFKVNQILGPFRALVLLLILLFLAGGGARSDIQSLLVLRPLSVVFLGYGLSRITRAQLIEYRFLFSIAAAMIALVLSQLVPLPPSIWTSLPSRDLIAEIDRTAELADIWRPISLVPSGTWNALFSLFPSLAVLILSVQLTAKERWRLLTVIISLGCISCLLAVMQLGNPESDYLYFYQVTNNGSAVGLFANRNHQAIFLASLVPMLAAYASADMPSRMSARIRSILSTAIGIFLVPLILVTGSRAGVFAFGLGIISIPLLYRFPSNVEHKSGKLPRWIIPSLIVIGLILILSFVTIWLGRAESIDRIITYTTTGEFRFTAWKTVATMAWQYFPIGSGFGSFAEVFNVYEPGQLLDTTYFNHAHNDWLEVIVAGGMPAALLISVAVLAFVLRIINLVKAVRDHHHVMACLGIYTVFLFGMASIVDYPLRVPSLAGIFCLALSWANGQKAFRVKNG